MDRVGRCCRHGFHRDGNVPEDHGSDGNVDGYLALAFHRHLAHKGCGHAALVREDKLEHVALGNNHRHLTTKAVKIQPDHLRLRLVQRDTKATWKQMSAQEREAWRHSRCSLLHLLIQTGMKELAEEVWKCGLTSTWWGR